jgi:hypothetical protein
MCLRILNFVKFKIHNYLRTKLSIMVQMNFLKNNSMENFPNYIDCIEQCKATETR